MLRLRKIVFGAVVIIVVLTKSINLTCLFLNLFSQIIILDIKKMNIIVFRPHSKCFKNVFLNSNFNFKSISTIQFITRRNQIY